MTVIKVVLVTGFLSILVWAFRNRSRAGLRAGGRVLAFAVAGIAVTAVLFPGTTVWAAHLVGVDRGTDLVVYLLALVFAVTAVSYHLRFRDLEHRLTRVVRDAALRAVLADTAGPDAAAASQDNP
jgi:hypothetical protein